MQETEPKVEESGIENPFQDIRALRIERGKVIHRYPISTNEGGLKNHSISEITIDFGPRILGTHLFERTNEKVKDLLSKFKEAFGIKPDMDISNQLGYLGHGKVAEWKLPEGYGVWKENGEIVCSSWPEIKVTLENDRKPESGIPIEGAFHFSVELYGLEHNSLSPVRTPDLSEDGLIEALREAAKIYLEENGDT
jgi:hypothetical protein